MTYARLPLTTPAASDPMRVLFCCVPAYGHVYPLLPLAIACREAGHDVEFATSGDFVLRLRRLGFPTHTAGLSIEQAQEVTLAAEPALADLPLDEKWRFGAALFGSVLARHKSIDLVPLMERTSPDLIVYEEYDVGAALAARVTGIPAVGHALGYQLPDRFRAPLSQQLEAVGRDEWPDIARADPFVANPYLDISPPSLRDPAASQPAERISQRPVSWAEPAGGIPDWVTAPRARPLAYLTLGTVVFGAVDSLRAALNGLAELDIDVLVTVGPNGDPTALGPVPDRVRVERFVPQDALLPYIDVVLHHCGSGTMLGGFARGLPQLALPHGADQFTNAEVLLRSGAGLRLVPAEISAEAIAECTHALLTDERFRNAARGLAAEIATMPAPSDVVLNLERMTARGRTSIVVQPA